MAFAAHPPRPSPNQTYAAFQKLLRVDTRTTQKVVVRETSLNSLAHRDYFFHTSTLTSIYGDRLEFMSIDDLCLAWSWKT